MIHLEEILNKVFATNTTKATIANNDILVSCDGEYFLPLYMCYKKNVKLPYFDAMLNIHTFFRDLTIKLVTKTSDGDVYMVLGFKCYHDDTRMSYSELDEMFPSNTVIDYETYTKYENEFLYYDYEFYLNHKNEVVVV